MERQLDLLGRGAPSFDREFRTLERRELSHGAWVDHVPSWVSGHDALFDELEGSLQWRRETMKMYDKTIEVPRLLARVPREGIVDEMRAAISAKYGEDFVFTTAALYRDGNDSVAFHGDTTARNMVEALVATVSLGASRRFMLRPAEGGPSIALPLGRGDLVVMGGTCQRTWRHGIPKVASAGPRIALMFRPKWAKNYRTSVDD
ncbi:MAG TPA: alpha-ketoglutarate-dependent dioxygenase AlkB [Kofleriaceae bacterium]|nr:alpha-ketoglutarate-dependent dioxygenase AlkB [Kofleriaceae bacterium]